MATATFSIWRGESGTGELVDYTTEVSGGMVVLDAVHQIQADQATDLACRWNCKAGKCGSCSAEINGQPKLMCMTRLDQLDLSEPVTVEPIRAFPHLRDLVTDVSWNFEVKKKIPRLAPRAPDAPDGTWRMWQEDVDRPQEFRKCIECFLCQDVCHVLRDHQLHDEFIGPRFLLYTAGLEMNPIDTGDRLEALRTLHGIGYCNITKCCTKVCPEEIKITDNAIIPLKERVIDEAFDPIAKLIGLFRGEGRVQLKEALMIELKPMTPGGVGAALAKAERYRLLSEPDAAESICLDVLAIEPSNQKALVMLLLARTDLIAQGIAGGLGRAREVLPQLTSEYERAYYAGIICERRGHAQRMSPSLTAASLAADWYREAMDWYEKAERLRPAGNDDAVIRWNSCARILNAHPELASRSDEPAEVMLDD